MEMRFADRGPMPVEPTQFSILLVCDTYREAENAARGIEPLVQTRGDVRIFPVGLGGSLGGIRVDLIIVGVTGFALRDGERHYLESRDWLRTTLSLRRHPQCGIIDINGVMKGIW